jgi:hypothetical protein
MTLSAPMRCSALAEELGEPMAGTVDQRRRWLLLEDRSAWGADAVEERFGADAVAEAKRNGLRLLLVRRREGDPADDAARRAFLVDTETREMAVRVVRGPADLSVTEALTSEVGTFGTSTSGPMVLVCTNGRRDACCALRGRAVVGALAASHPELLWECTHLGGHRFAANVVWLPEGIVHGRVGPADGPGLVEGLLAGHLDVAKLRGRSSWPAPAQAAEAHLRRRLDLHGIDDVALTHATADGDRATVTLAAQGTEHHVTLLGQPAEPARAISCRADETESPIHWHVTGA